MYNETELLIHYQTDIMDDFLKAHLNGLFVYGGDLIVILLQYLLEMFVVLLFSQRHLSEHLRKS